jgi:hypothetical protein
MANATRSRKSTQQGTRRGRPPKQAGKQAAQPARSTREEQRRVRSATVNLPFVTAQFRVPEVHVPRQQDLASAADAVRSRLPSREQALFYGGLTAGAAFAIIDWPVALAVGVGHALVTRSRGKQESGASSK